MERALVDRHLLDLITKKSLAFPLDLKPFVQPASIDLPVSGRAFLVKEKVLPFQRRIKDILPQLVLQEHSLAGDGMVLLKGQTYLLECGTVALPAGCRGVLSPKSSIGRIDVMVRGVIDGGGL